MPPRQALRRRFQCAAAVLLLAVFFLFADGRSLAAPVSAEQALETAYAWLSLEPNSVHAHLAGTILPVLDPLGDTEFYAVDLAPRGYVIVAADDAVEPIIAFSTSEVFQAAPGHPLFDILRGDVPARIARARAGLAASPAKWKMLRAVSGAPKVLANDAAVYSAGAPAKSAVSDVRVAPLIASEWDQLTDFGLPIYNYYTPPYAAGNPANYCAGCVATMLGQIMRYHQWPQIGVGTASYQITVDNSSQERALLGGDGAGGSYSWADMPLEASANMPAAEQQAIGALLADAGVASNMDYEPSGSAASFNPYVLTDVFQYANAAFSWASLSTIEPAIRANLDAGLPVGLAISGAGEGHAVVVDGYGYNATTLYHHLNMGWSGANDAWYNLPSVNVGTYDFNVITGVLYNIDPAVSGEIVSGRITDSAGRPVAGALVAAASGSVVVTATSNAQGIYGIKGLASNTAWTLTPSEASRAFTPASLPVTTGYSSPDGRVGDKTGLDFSAQVITGSVTVQINAGAAAAGARWRVNRGAWQVSGATVAGVPVGTGTVAFRAAGGWATPASEPVAVAENQTTSVTVTYDPQYSLTVAPDNAPDGQASADPSPGPLGSYPRNTRVTITATPAAGYYFAGWVENGMLVDTDTTYTLLVKSARHLVANFPPDSLTGSNTQLYVTDNRAAETLNVLANIGDTAGTPAVLSVTQPANGTVTINTDGTLTFVPGKNFHGSTQFSCTAGDGTGTITREVTISNWFAASAGTYAGLSLAGDLTNETSGYLTATVVPSGAFTGRLTVAGLTYGLSGAFDNNANYRKVIQRTDASNLNLSLHLVPASEITGSIDDGVAVSAITASRSIFGPANKAPQAGSYAALLSGNSTVPGNGYLAVRISPAGAVTATGRLADGTPVSMGARLNADGSAPYYTGLYKSAAGAGSVLGTMFFQPGAAVECTGTYAWFRPRSSASLYPGGFAESGSVTGSLLAGATAGLQSAQAGGVTVELSGGGLALPIFSTGQSPASGKLAWSGSGAGSLIVARSGQVTGSFIDPAARTKRVVLGMWLANQQLGGGFFLGSGSAGALTLFGQ